MGGWGGGGVWGGGGGGGGGGWRCKGVGVAQFLQQTHVGEPLYTTSQVTVTTD